MDQIENHRPSINVILQPHSPYELSDKLAQIDRAIDELPHGQPVTFVMESLNTTPDIVKAFKEGVANNASWGVSLEDLLARTYFASGAESQKINHPKLSPINLKAFMRSRRLPAEIAPAFAYEEKAFKTLFGIGIEIANSPSQSDVIIKNRFASLDKAVSDNTNLVYNAIIQGFVYGNCAKKGIPLQFDFESNIFPQIVSNFETLNFIRDSIPKITESLFDNGITAAANIYRNDFLEVLSDKFIPRDQSIANTAEQHYHNGNSVIVIAGNSHSGILHFLSSDSLNVTKVVHFGPQEFSLIHRMRNNETITQEELERSMLLYLFFNKTNKDTTSDKLHRLSEQIKSGSREEVLSLIRQLYKH